MHHQSSSFDLLSDNRVEFGSAGTLAIAGGVGGVDAGNTLLGANTLGVTGVPQFTYTTNIIGDPWPIAATVVNEYTVLSIPGFWRGINFLCHALGSLPAEVCRESDDGTRSRLAGHPMAWLLTQEINALQTAIDTKATLFEHALIWGNGYALIDRGPNGAPIAVWNLMPDRVIPFRFIGADGQPKQYYLIGTAATAGGPFVVPASDVIHIAGLGFDGMKGYPLVQLMAQTLRVGKSSEAFGDRFFSNGGHLGGVIESEKTLTPEQVESVRTQIASGYTGVANSHRWMVLMGGAKAKTLTLPPDSAQFLETRKFSVVDVARILGVPPHILYELDRATWNNIEHMGIELVKFSLGPWVVKAEQEFSRKLLGTGDRQKGIYIRLNVEELQRGDHTQQADVATKRIATGLTTINEERAKMHLPGIGAAGDVHFVPAQIQSVDRAVAPPAPAPSTTPGAPPAATPPAARAAAEKPKVDVAHFAELFAAAAKRVGSKTSRATDNARAKYLNVDPAQMTTWTAWGNAFAEEQGRYAAEAVQPILSTYSSMSASKFSRRVTSEASPAGYEEFEAIEAPQAAAIVGQIYAAGLRGYYSQLARREEGAPPDLAQICSKFIQGER